MEFGEHGIEIATPAAGRLAMTLKEKAVLNPAYYKRGVGEFKYSNFDIARPVEYSLFIPRGKEFGA